LSLSEQLAIFSHKPCRVGSPQSIFQPGLCSAGELMISWGKLDYRNSAVSFENWFHTLWFQFLKGYVFNAPFVSLSANYTVYYCSSPVVFNPKVLLQPDTHRPNWSFSLIWFSKTSVNVLGKRFWFTTFLINKGFH